DSPLRSHAHPISRAGRQVPKIGKDSVRESEGFGELDLFLQGISDRSDPVISGFIKPPLEARPNHRGHNRVIAPVQNLARIFSKRIESSEMGDLRQGGEISEKIGERVPHLVELIEIIVVPRKSRSSAMSGDDLDPALKW